MAPPTPRGQRGGNNARSSRGNNRGNAQGRGRGRGGAGNNTPSSSGSKASGFLQSHRSKNNQSQSISREPSPNRPGSSNNSPNLVRDRSSSPNSKARKNDKNKKTNDWDRDTKKHGDKKDDPRLVDMAKAKFEVLKRAREQEKKDAIRDGKIHAPGSQITLENAISLRGTCEDMCPEFERVERVKNNAVNRLEKAQHQPGGPWVPAGERMVKEFKRPDAGRDEQLPSDIRTPTALVSTMDYLIEEVINKEDRLMTCHNFVWDRTRAVRNDFSIMQVTSEADVRMAVDCHERTARFLILSLHVLSSEDQLHTGEHFDSQQDVEQLNNTFTSLFAYYQMTRMEIEFPNEPEFRSYQILFDLIAATPDIQDRASTWPTRVLHDPRVQVAMHLYQLAVTPLRDQGPLRPFTPEMVAQFNGTMFWDTLSSPAVSYMMACVAEISFFFVRFGFLKALWKSVKSAPKKQQESMREWTVTQMRDYLGFDFNEQVEAYCADLDLGFYGINDKGEKYLDFTRDSIFDANLENAPKKQVFSQSYVEEKRYHRTYASVINGRSVAEAIEAHEVFDQEVEAKGTEELTRITPEVENPMFFPDTTTPKPGSLFTSSQAQQPKPFGSGMFASSLDPSAKPFQTGLSGGFSGQQTFGQGVADTSKMPGTFSTSIFAQPTSQQPASGLFNSLSSGRFSTSGGQTTAAPALSSPLTQQSPSQGTGLGRISAAEGGTLDQKLNLPSQSASSFTPPKNETTQKPFSWPAPATLETSGSDTSSANLNFPQTSQQRNPFGSATFGGAPPPQSSERVTEQASPQPEAPKAALPKFGFSTTQSQATSPQSPQKYTFPPATQQPPAVTEAGETQPTAPAITLSEFKPTQPGSKQPAFEFKSTPLQPAFESKAVPRPTNSESRLSYSQSTFEFKGASASAFGSSPSPVAPPASVPHSSIQQATPQPSTTPPTSPPTTTSLKKQDYVDIVARLALTQPKGLLHEYLEYTLEKILPQLIEQHQTEVLTEKITRLKTNALSRKFGKLWRRFAYESSLNRRALQRRAKFAESLRMEAEKKRKREDDVQEILAAMEDSKRIKDEQKKMKEDAEKARKEQDAKMAHLRQEKTQSESKKRKSVGEQSSDLQHPIRIGSELVRTHKRSRTLGTSMLPPPRPGQQANDTSFRHSIFSSGHSSLGQLSRSPSLRNSQQSRSDTRPQQDNTRTDFFRLLAHGIDPETPLVPLTQSQVEAKAKREENERQAQLNAIYNRRKVGQSARPSSTSPAPQVDFNASTPSTRDSTPRSTYDPESDDLIREIRETRRMLAEGSEWMKEQSTTLEREYQEMKLQSSTSSQGSPGVSINGVDYIPASGPSMSRTERLIRGYGLDKPKPKYKPLKGSDYVAVPMSKTTAAHYQMGVGEIVPEEVEEIGTNGTAKKRRKHADVDRSYRPDPRFDEEEPEEDYNALPPKRVKGVRHAPPAPRIKPSNNPFNHLSQDEDLYEDEDDVLEDDEDQNHYYPNGTEGDTEDMGEDDDTELLEDEEEDDDLVEDDEDDYAQDYLRPGSQPYDDAPTPATQVSHVSSGPGASKEDAIALSDSD